MYPSATRSDHGDAALKAFFDHSSAQRVNTHAVIARALQAQYPDKEIIVVPEGNCNLFEYSNSTGKASYHQIHDDSAPKSVPQTLILTAFNPPSHRVDKGHLGRQLLLGKFLYNWGSHQFLVYFSDGRDGTSSFPQMKLFYILTDEKSKAEALVEEAGKWTNEIHEEVWMFDAGYWQKSAELYDSVRHASWDNVILDPAMKRALINDHTVFFKSKEKYAKLQVPWKRGIIYYGPPGNGKTISIKAMMHLLYSLPDPVPTLYVRSLTSFNGPEYSIKSIFEKARMMAPCYLVLEDLDSLIGDNVRSYFLNEVDGLKANDGIFMIGSTNHLDRLDEGVSKRPSRFDRKYQFKDPNKDERIAYCHFWQTKLKDNKDIEFPDVLCEAIAGITDKFSFAYMQEAFVATLLAIALTNDEMDFSSSHVKHNDGEWIDLKSVGDDDLDKYILWTEMKKQVETLREGIQGKQQV